MPRHSSRSSPKTKEGDPPPFTKEELEDFKESVAVYCYRNGLNAKDIKPSVE
jgi:hypothetical protein